MRYLYAAKAPYKEILTAARAVEAEQEDYKEMGAVTAKAAQGTDPELMEELASIKAVVKKAWNAQQNSQQKSKKQGNEKRITTTTLLTRRRMTLTMVVVEQAILSRIVPTLNGVL